MAEMYLKVYETLLSFCIVQHLIMTAGTGSLDICHIKLSCCLETSDIASCHFWVRGQSVSVFLCRSFGSEYESVNRALQPAKIALLWVLNKLMAFEWALFLSFFMPSVIIIISSSSGCYSFYIMSCHHQDIWRMCNDDKLGDIFFQDHLEITALLSAFLSF